MIMLALQKIFIFRMLFKKFDMQIWKKYNYRITGVISLKEKE